MVAPWSHAARYRHQTVYMASLRFENIIRHNTINEILEIIEQTIEQQIGPTIEPNIGPCGFDPPWPVLPGVKI